MQFITRIYTIEEFKTLRNQLGKTIETKLGSRLGQRKLDEVFSDFLGVSDFNTAIGIMKNKDEKTEELDKNANRWLMVLSTLVFEKLIDVNVIQEDLDELVFDFIGTGKHVSNNINNQGWITQLTELLKNDAEKDIKNQLASSAKISITEIENYYKKTK
jgi:hypothetical protein